MNSRPERPKATRTYPLGVKRNGQTDIGSDAGASKDDRLSKKSSTTKGTNESRHSKSNRTNSRTSVGTGKGSQTARVSKVFVPPVIVTNMMERQNDVPNSYANVSPIYQKLTPKGLPKGFVSREQMEAQVVDRRKTNKCPVGFVSREEMEKRVLDRRDMRLPNGRPNKASNQTVTIGTSAGSKGTIKSKQNQIKTKQDRDKGEQAIETTPRIETKFETDGNFQTENMSQAYSPERVRQTDDKQNDRQNKNTCTLINKKVNETVDNKNKNHGNGSLEGSKRITRSVSGATKISCIPQPQSLSKTIPKTAPLVSVKVLIMNANGSNDKEGAPTDRRKNAISDVVGKHSPHLVLFQEFSWTGIKGKTWSKWPIPDHYLYKGHFDASIMYDVNSIAVSDVPATDIDTITTLLQSNAKNRLKRTFPMDFNPVSRMLMSHIVAQTKPALDFICVSWHGVYRKMSQLKRIEYFEYLIEFLRIVKEKYKLPMLVGGDFNIDMYTIEHLVQPPFKLCVYEASVRRTIKGIIDFYIVTEELQLEETTWVDLERDTTVIKPNGVLDHDPVVATLKPIVDKAASGQSSQTGSQIFL